MAVGRLISAASALANVYHGKTQIFADGRAQNEYRETKHGSS